jgi:uncharacterized GH25 family protein
MRRPHAFSESSSIILMIPMKGFQMRTFIAPWACLYLLSATVFGHDTWVQTAARIVRPEDVVHVDLALGNHGNEHRDFKFAGKLASLDGVVLDVIGPSGRRTDLVPEMVDLGFAAKEGFWSGRFVTAESGLHCIAHSLDRLHGTKRTVKSGKAYFLVADRLDAPPEAGGGFATPLGHALEIVPETHPVARCGPGKKIGVRLFYRGRPLADERVSFIPRGAKLAGEFDPEYERKTDAEGRCSYEPKEGNYILVVAHRAEPEERGEGYDRTSYSATLVLNVPQRCACCE